MKKSLVALAALSFIGAASAQSSVTMYGAVEPTIDIAYKNTTDTRVDTTPTGGATTTTSTRSQYKPGFRVQDGNDQGTGTSRIGWLGTEDLGGGLKAKFQLEMGLRVDDGCVTTGAGNVCSSGNSGGNLFGRNAWLGIQGSLGEVRLGRQVLGSFGVQGKSWAAGSSSGLYDAGAMVTTPMGGVRFSNAIKYLSPNMGGFQGTVTLAAPEVAAAANDTSTTGAGVTSTTNAKAKTGVDLALEYANGPLYLGAGYNKTNAVTGTNNGLAGPLNSVTTTSGPVKGHTLGAAYDFGVVKPFLNFSRTVASPAGTTVTNGLTTQTLAANTGTRARAWTLGVRAPIGAATLIAAYGTEKTTGAGNALTAGALTGQRALYSKEKAAQIGMQYPLSKRTLLEANVGRYKADTTSRDTTIVAGTATSSALTTTNNKITAFNFGIKHSF